MSAMPANLRWAARLVACLAVAASMAGCDSPVGPEGFSVSGNWIGTWQYTSAGTMVTDAVTLTLTQADDTATGQWSAESGASGTLSIQPRGATTGSLTITQPLLGGETCTGTTTVSGSASGERIDLMVSDLPPTGLCQWATGQRFTLTKQ